MIIDQYEGFAKVDNTMCSKFSHTFDTSSTFSDAIRKCNESDKCNNVYDSSCNGRGIYTTCTDEESMTAHYSFSSCIYKKKGIISSKRSMILLSKMLSIIYCLEYVSFYVLSFLRYLIINDAVPVQLRVSFSSFQPSKLPTLA